MGKIVVSGSANTDLVVKTDRMPWPGETILGGSFMMSGGGKGANQALAASRQGGEVTFEAEDHQSVLARYWKIEIESNWGDPNYVELLELKFYGQVLSKTVNVKWVDSESSCNSVALSTSVLDFGFATTSENLRALERGEFKLRVNRKEFGPYTVLTSAKQIRDDMHEGGLTITVSKYSLVEARRRVRVSACPSSASSTLPRC